MRRPNRVSNEAGNTSPEVKSKRRRPNRVSNDAGNISKEVNLLGVSNDAGNISQEVKSKRRRPNRVSNDAGNMSKEVNLLGVSNDAGNTSQEVKSKRRRPNRASNDAGNMSKEVKSKRQEVVNRLASELYANVITGKLKRYGATEQCFKDNIGICPWLKKECLRNAFRRITKNYRNDNNDLNVNVNTISTNDNEFNIPLNVTLNEPCFDTSSSMSESKTSDSSKSAIGRPIGSTKSATQDLEKRKREALHEATLRCVAKKAETKESSSELVKSKILKRIMNEVEIEFEIPENSLNRKTTHSRIRRRSLTPNQRGPKSPLAPIEKILVTIFKQRAAMNQPLNCTNGLELVRSMISGSKHEEELNKYHQYKEVFEGSASKGTISKKYWYNFKRRHRDVLKTMKGRRLDLSRDKWSKYRNFKMMYNLLYDEMENCKIAEKCSKKWVNARGETVSKCDAVGLPIDLELKHPDFLLHVDECGFNLNSREDGKVGGETFIGSVSNEKLMTRANETDCRTTIMGFTNSLGEPVLCVIIIKATQLEYFERYGVDLEATYDRRDGVDLDEERELNTGPGKWFPGGPVCYYKDKEVRSLVCTSEGGGINSSILTEIFKKMDKLELFDRSIATPMVVLDGHDSRFHEDFLSYINDPQHIWKVCIGVPYGTHHWQVGDAPEQNGCFKIHITKGKQNIFRKKTILGLPPKLERSDIVPLINFAWKKSFARVESNRRAICQRGWNPLNRALLCDEFILNTKDANDDDDEIDFDEDSSLSDDSAGSLDEAGSLKLDSKSGDNDSKKVQIKMEKKPILLNIKSEKEITCIEVNTAHGYANEVLAEITQFKAHESSVSDTVRKWKAEGHSLQEAVARGKRVTSGLAYAHKKPVLDSEYRDIFIAKRHKKEESERSTLLGKMKKYYLQLHKYNEIKNKYNEPFELSKMNNNELKIIATWHGRSKDDPIPTTNDALLERILNAMHRGSFTIEQYLKDVGVDDDKLVDMSVYPPEEEFLQSIQDEITERTNLEATKTFDVARAKCQKEKEKFFKMKEDLQELIVRIYDGNADSFDDSKLKLLKDLKLYVTLKSNQGDDSIPSTIVKLRERIEIIRTRPFSELKTYLIYKGCTRNDVLDALC